MEPVLRGGDFLLAVRGVPVRRGSLLVVEHPADPGHEMVKRAVGVPGDTVDGQRLGPGRLWVLGDDPSASTDSRAFGPVPMELVKGVVVARYWPPSAVTWFA
jgi:inner membrane protease subunit 1